MDNYDCYFSPYYADGIEDFAARLGWLDFTVLGGRHMQDTIRYLQENNLHVDPRGEGNDYDLVVTCSDLIVPKNIRSKRLMLVQEGITEPEGLTHHLVKALKFLPRYLANTSMSGLSDAYDIFCVASTGYRDLFIRKGVRPEKIAVTGIPNFDDFRSVYKNTFPHHGYVLAATTPYRETFRFERRIDFLKKCAEIAHGRPLIFKLHPLENYKRAWREIKRIAPAALVFHRLDVNAMIANADVVITQQSTCTFVALALGKEVHTYLNEDELHRLMPNQNNGASASAIAGIAKRLLRTPMAVLEQVRAGSRRRPGWEHADAF